MGFETELTSECLDRLVAPDGAASPAWFTRVHRELARRCPGDFVVRLGETLDNLREWLEVTETPCEAEDLLFSLLFDDDRDGPRLHAEGGWLAFQWRGNPYRVISVRVPAQRSNETHAWLVSPGREAAEALVDAVGRRTWKKNARVMVFENGDWEDAPRLEADLAGYRWDSVVLPEATRARLERAVQLFFTSEQVYADLEIPWKLGFLFVGPPGTGKTLTTKVLAGTCGVPFLYVRGLNSFYDSKPDAGTLREMFRGARDRAPCILCLEDVDALVSEDLRSTFLNELDGLEENYRGVLTVATTNHPERLDPGLLHRPSRFDYRFEFPLPDEGQRRAFVRHWAEKLVRLGYVTRLDGASDEIVGRSRGMSHAYLKRVLVGTVLRMHTNEERGDAAFLRLALEELEDAQQDQTLARRAETVTPAVPGARVGFRVE
jgi:hypothetical protein